MHRFSMGLGLFLCVACSCSKQATPHRCLQFPNREGVAIARVGNAAIMIDDVRTRLMQRGVNTLRRYGEKTKLKAFVEDQVRFELLVQAALERGLHRDIEVVEAVRKIMVRRLLQHDLTGEVFETMNDRAVGRYYERHRDEYLQQRKVRIFDIELAPTEEGRATAGDLIEQLQRRPDHLAQLGKRYSLRKLPKTPGISQLFKNKEEYLAEYGPYFTHLILAAQPDQLISEPVQSIRGWHVIKILAVREALTRPLDEVRDEIREKLMSGARSKAFRKYLNEIRTRHPVAIYDGRIDELAQQLNTHGGAQ